MKVEQRFRSRPVVDQPVERGEERDALPDVPSVQVRMRVPYAPYEAHARGAKSLLLEESLGLAQRHGLGLRVPAVGEIPEPLAAAPADDRNLRPAVQDLEHLGHPARAEPAVRSALHGGVVFELSREERSAPFELAQHVASEARIRFQERRTAALPVVRRTAAAHPCAQQRKRLDRPHVRVPLEEPALDPEQPLQLGAVVRAETAPEHELLRRRDGRDRIDLEEAEPPDGVEDRARGPVEELRAHCDAPCFLEADDVTRDGGEAYGDRAKLAP